MKKQFAIVTTFVVLGLIGVGSAKAQFTIPKLPKITKTPPVPAPPSSETGHDPQSSTRTQGQSSEDSSSTGAVSDCAGDAALDIHLANIETTRKQAADYRPGTRDYYVKDFNDDENIYLKAALSPKKRKEWLENWSEHDVGCLTPALENLAEVARKTLPNYTGPLYSIHNSADEKLLLSGITDIANAQVLRIGIKEASWQIAKDDFNLPTSRYKHGLVYARYPASLDGFCRVIYVNIVQDYAGGGTYADSHANFITSEYAGCPASK